MNVDDDGREEKAELDNVVGCLFPYYSCCCVIVSVPFLAANFIQWETSIEAILCHT